MTDMHPSWKPLTPESWKGAQDVWLLAGVWIYSAEGEAKDVCAEYLPALCTHWQPAAVPPIYADAQPSKRREWYVAFYNGGEAQYVYDTQPTHRRTVKVREVLPGDDAQPSELVDQLRKRAGGLEAGLRAVKTICAGERAPYWVENMLTVTNTRGLILDIVDDALAPAATNGGET